MEVRELLLANSASNSSNESAPLSAPDLHALKERLHIRSLQIKDRVHKHVKSHYGDFSAIISAASQTAAEVEDLSKDVGEIVRTLDKDPIDKEICRLISKRASLKKELQEKKELLAALRDISAVSESLWNVRELIERGKLSEAAQGLRTLPEFLSSTADMDGTHSEIRNGNAEAEHSVMGVLKAERACCFSKLQGLLEDLFANAVEVDNSNSRLCIKRHVKSKKLPENRDGLDFCSVLSVMDMIGTLDVAFGRLGDMLMKYIMTPVINISAIEITMDEANEHAPVLYWLLSPEFEGQRTTVTPGTLYQKLLQILQFLYCHICFQNEKWMTCFGRLIWPRLSESIIANCLSKAVPTEAPEVAKFQKILEMTKDFEYMLKKISFISASDIKDARLSCFAENIEVHFALKKRKHNLARVRRLLVYSDFSTAVENSELLFQPTTLKLSWAARQLMEIVHEVLQDACSSTMKVAMEFYHTVRDSIILYKAIVPVKLAKELPKLSQAAIVVHNDCRYIAQEVLGLAFEYKSSFPDELKNIAVFVDLAPVFHQLAEELLSQQIAIALSRLKEAVDQANGFQDTHKKQQSEMASLALDQVVLLLEKIRMLWQPVLQPSLYCDIMRSMLEHLFSRISTEILTLDDMAVEETFQLQQLIQTTLRNLSRLLVSVVEDKGILETEWDKFEEVIPSLRKLRQIAELLDMPLKAVTVAWENGELAASGFTAFEVSKLIRAIFSDTPLRKECLSRIDLTDGQ